MYGRNSSISASSSPGTVISLAQSHRVKGNINDIHSSISLSSRTQAITARIEKTRTATMKRPPRMAMVVLEQYMSGTEYDSRKASTLSGATSWGAIEARMDWRRHFPLGTLLSPSGYCGCCVGRWKSKPASIESLLWAASPCLIALLGPIA